jgi:hypothetical protein
MTTSEWIINFALIAVVLRQMQTHRIDARFVLVPLALVGWSAHTYLKAVPTAGHDLALVVVIGLIGAAFGLAGGLSTHIGADGSHATARAGLVSAGLWVVGMSGRIGFVLWSEHGGADSIAHFSRVHQITGSDAWTSALIIMVFAEVGIRLAIIVLRGRQAMTVANTAQLPVFAA